jgi:hypothetical protein
MNARAASAHFNQRFAIVANPQTAFCTANGTAKIAGRSLPRCRGGTWKDRSWLCSCEGRENIGRHERLSNRLSFSGALCIQPLTK